MLKFYSISTIYTCGGVTTTKNQPPAGTAPISGTGQGPSVSITVSHSSGFNLSVTAHRPPPTTSHETLCSSEVVERRQTAAFTSPYCLKKFSRANGGDAGISGACDCFNLPTPVPVLSTVTVTDKLNTITSTNIINVGCWAQVLAYQSLLR